MAKDRVKRRRRTIQSSIDYDKFAYGIVFLNSLTDAYYDAGGKCKNRTYAGQVASKLAKEILIRKKIRYFQELKREQLLKTGINSKFAMDELKKRYLSTGIREVRGDNLLRMIFDVLGIGGKQKIEIEGMKTFQFITRDMLKKKPELGENRIKEDVKEEEKKEVSKTFDEKS